MVREGVTTGHVNIKLDFNDNSPNLRQHLNVEEGGGPISEIQAKC